MAKKDQPQSDTSTNDESNTHHLDVDPNDPRNRDYTPNEESNLRDPAQAGGEDTTRNDK